TSVLLESVLETFTVLNEDGTVRYQSPWVERMLGYPQGELSGRNVFDLIHPEDCSTVSGAFSQVVRNLGSTIAAEFRFRHKNGTWQVVQAAGKSLRDETGAVKVVISARNVSERKQAEEKLLRLSNAVQMSTDSIVLTDLEGKITEVNPATLRMY